MVVSVGTILYGYCGGYFGDHTEAYDDKRVEALGADWVIARSVESRMAVPLFADIPPFSLEEYTVPDPEHFDVES